MRIITAISSREPSWRRVVLAGATLIIIAGAFRAISKSSDGDFRLHWEFGRRFLAGQFLYAGGHDIPYPPFWAMAHALPALLPMPLAKALLVPFGVAVLVGLLWTLRRLAVPAFNLNKTGAFWAGAAALFLASRFVVRDMAELGVNTAIVTLSWFAIYLWRERREWLGGASLGLAIALKCTPAIFVAYFVWKRQWRMALITGFAAGCFTLAPILWQGPVSYYNHMAVWSANVWKGAGGKDPSVGVLGPETVQNIALRPALARYLIHLPAEHPGRALHPLYVDVLNLSPTVASWVIRMISLALLAAVMWWSRENITARDDPRLLWEFAAISTLMLLLSPITWGQHCVAAIPACYFISALFLQRSALPVWMMALIAVYIVFVPLLSRDLVGVDVSLLLASYHVRTFSLLGLLAVAMGCRRLQPLDVESVSLTVRRLRL